MLESLKQRGRHLGQEIGREWEQLSQGWRELLRRSSGALTHFARKKDRGTDLDLTPADFPQWSLLAGEVEETAGEVVVRVEVPGMEKDDCRVTIENNVLYLEGERRFEREQADSTWHLTERAYGAFQRAFPLPRSVVLDQAKANYRNGVLTVRLPKAPGGGPTHVPVS